MFLALAGNKKIIAWHLLVHAIVAVLETVNRGF